MPFRLIYLLAILLLAACEASDGQLSSSSSDQVFLTSTSLVRATPLETGLPEASEASKEATDPQIEADCRLSEGQVESYDLASDYLDAGLQFRVFLPPCYVEQEQRYFPVLYLIHGQTFNEDQWDRLGADEIAQSGIAEGLYEPFIIVMPHDLSYAQPSIDPFREAFIQELIPYVEDNFRALTERESRAVGGLSRGASWAIHFALHYPKFFAAVGGHSPPIFVEDAPIMRDLLAGIDSERMPRIWLDIGEKDQQAILNSAIWFEDLLTELAIPHEWHLFPGNHDEAYWSEHLPLYLDWYSQGWN